MISKIGIRSNPKPRSRALANELKNALYDRGYLLTENHPDLWIAVGGDGTFLRMVRETGFDPDTMYVGIHTGTLGFLQEIHPEQLYDFLDYIDKGEYTYDIKDILVTEIHSETGAETLYSLNEILIRNAALKTMKAIVKIDGTFLEKFTGDGLMISTSVGSTAYNMCFGGAIVDNAFDDADDADRSFDQPFVSHPAEFLRFPGYPHDRDFPGKAKHPVHLGRRQHQS